MSLLFGLTPFRDQVDWAQAPADLFGTLEAKAWLGLNPRPPEVGADTLSQTPLPSWPRATTQLVISQVPNSPYQPIDGNPSQINKEMKE